MEVPRAPQATAAAYRAASSSPRLRVSRAAPCPSGVARGRAQLQGAGRIPSPRAHRCCFVSGRAES
eukprot:8676706-Pyramimonas_sp.AAC.1